jgi:hypothetical protein
MAGWETLRGGFTAPWGEVAYELFVEPSRIGLYRVTRYRVTAVPGTGGDAAPPMDTVQFISHPGQRRPLCYQRPVSAGAKAPWVLLAPGSPSYNEEMWRGIEVFQRQQKAHLKALDASGR